MPLMSVSTYSTFLRMRCSCMGSLPGGSSRLWYRYSSRMPHVLALAQGTTRSRATVFDDSRPQMAAAQREFRQIFPRPGWVEHDPKEIWESQLAVAREALERAGLAAREVARVGITNEREAVVVWARRAGEPVTNAIVWQDRRTAGLCDRLRSEGREPLFRQRTGLVL